MRLWPRSLIARILVVELAAIAVSAIALPAITVTFLHQEVARFERSSLAAQAQQIARSLNARGGAIELSLRAEIRSTYATPYDGRAFAVTDAAGDLIVSSAYADLVPWRRAPRADTLRDFRAGEFFGVSMPVERAGRRLWVVVTRDESGPGVILDDVTQAFLWRFVPFLLAILLLLPIVNSLLVGRLVVAVRGVSRQAEGIRAHQLDTRLEEEGLPLEVAPLVRATNGLLARLTQSYRQQAEFVANVAHEVRTPLAGLKVDLEDVADQAVRQRLSRNVDRLTHVIAQMQDLASLENTGVSRLGSFDAVDLAHELVAEHAPAVFAAGDRIGLEAPDVPVLVRGNRTLAGLALANLITNASRHTPAGTSIQVRVRSEGTIAVHDDGPGIAASDADLSRQRFWRADQLRSDSAGLGLSIVDRIMEVHHGRLAIENTAGAGARFTLAFELVERRGGVGAGQTDRGSRASAS